MASESGQKVEEFMAITGSSKDIAESLLAACDNNLEMAINMHMEGVQTEDNSAVQSASNGSQPGTSSAPVPIDPDEGKILSTNDSKIYQKIQQLAVNSFSLNWVIFDI